MKIHPSLIIATSLLVSQLAIAGNSISRQQVEQELLEARQTGNITASDTGQKLNEIAPGNYPQAKQQRPVTRAQVEAELADALKSGDMMASESGQKQNEINPTHYR